MIYGGACPSPFIIPFVAWKSLPIFLKLSPYLLGIPPLSWREFPSTPIPGWLYTDALPPSPPPSLFPVPHSSPFQIHVLLRRHCDIGFTQSEAITFQKWINDLKFLKSLHPLGNVHTFINLSWIWGYSIICNIFRGKKVFNKIFVSGYIHFCATAKSIQLKSWTPANSINKFYINESYL